MQPAANHRGRVYFVGAGPGDPGLITVRGAECLRAADVVVYDGQIHRALLDGLAPSVEVVCVGRGPGEPPLSHQAVAQRLVEAAQQGKTVVRLKVGDPELFGGTAEEIAAVRAAGVAVETVPGITAALAAAAYAEIPITHPDYASAVALVTARESEGKSGPPLDYRPLAQFPGTLIFYMGEYSGEGSACRWSEELIGGGMSPDTPVAIVRRCTWNDQQTVRCTLGTLRQEIADRKLRTPAVIVVGQVVSLAPAVSRFAAAPLFGVRVVVTRAREQAEALCDRFARLGAEVLVQPVIRISDPPDWGPVDAALARLPSYDWLVFSSSNGVRYLLERLLATGGDMRRLSGVRLAAIGPGTAEELARYRLCADLVPDRYRAEALAAALAEGASGRRFLLARASRGREVLAEELRAAGGKVDQIVVYSSSDVEKPDPHVAEALAAAQVDWVTVTSSAIARSLVRLFGEGEKLRRTKLASISPVTSETLRALGYEPAVEAAQYTMEGLVDAILEYVRSGKTR